MSHEEVSRRDLIKLLGLGTASAWTLSMFTDSALADLRVRKDAPAGLNVDVSGATPCRLEGDRVVRPSVAVPKIHETDVLVVGGGAAGCAAAIAAARSGVKVTLVERYGHFGGLVTGGLVVKILSHRAENNQLVGRGIGEEMMQRLEQLPNGIIGDYRNSEPTVDAEVYKYLLIEMITEANIDVFLHSWALDAIMDGNRVAGAVFQTKMGPQAVLAKQTIDTTGDGDVFASAGAEHERRQYYIGLPHRIGNVDQATPQKDAKRPRGLGDVTPIPGVRWVNMQGPDGDGCDVKTLSRMELNHRKQIWKQVRNLQETPGYEKVYLMETAPQIGVRVTRVLNGVTEITYEDAQKNRKYDDCVGIGGAWNGEHAPWQIPYGSMLPRNVENLLTAGRSTSSDPRMSELVRVIVPCWVTGQAAGCAAAVAVLTNTTARNVDLAAVRKRLIDQKAFLG